MAGPKPPPSAAPETVPLSQFAGTGTKEVTLSEVADDAGFIRTMRVRQQAFAEEVADRVLKLFRISVLSTVLLCIALAAVDGWFILEGWIKPAERLVTERVLMSIIGASIVQVGAASSAIVYSLFKQSKTEGGQA